MKKNLKKNYFYNLLYQIIVIILPIVTTPYLSRVLGVNNIGIYSYTLSISSLFILFGTIGISLYGQREIAYLQNDQIKKSETFWEIIIFRIITLLISLIIYFFIFIYNINDYTLFYKILSIEIIASAFDISWFFMGIEEFKKTSIRNIIVKLLCVMLIFIFVKSKNDLKIYFLIYVISILLGNISLWFYLPKYLKKVKLKNLKILKHLKPTISLFIPQIAIQIYTILDRTMIGTIITDKSEVGFYDQSQKIINLLLTIVTALGTVMMPRIASSFASGKKEKVNEYMEKSFNIVFFLSIPIVLGTIIVSNNFVPIFFGNGYDKVSILMKITSLIIIFIGISNVIGVQYLLPTKRQKEYTLSVIFGSVVNIIINSLLIGKYGSIGASIGTVIAELTVTIIQIYFTRHEFNWKKILKVAKNYIISGLVMYVCCFALGKVINDGLSLLILQVLVGVSTYMLNLVILKDDFIMNIFKQIIDKMKGKNNEKI